MQQIHMLLIASIIFVIIIGFIEIYYPSLLTIDGFVDGFSDYHYTNSKQSAFINTFIPPAIIGDDPTDEQQGFLRDVRYFHGRADVQRLGKKQDYCRMIVPSSSSNSTDLMFFACDLGGTSGLSTVSFRSQNVASGFQLSRDDYMNDLGDGRDSYCRILKTGSIESEFQCMCNPATDTGFRSGKMTVDSSPPPNIALLLTFYEGCVFWLRLRDDTLDYAKNLTISSFGNCIVDEHPPAPDIARGLHFNGIDQFLRIGDNTDLTFGYRVDLQYLRGFMFWVKFDKFTNNAHIFDFGDGPGKNNVWIGIVGRGNSNISGDSENNTTNGNLFDSCSLLPSWPSGAQCPDLVSPQQLMETTQANVNDFICPGPTITGRIMPPVQPKINSTASGNSADIAYEIWDHQQRKLRVQINNAVHLDKWTHVCVSALNPDPTKPDIGFYINGELVHTERAGWLPQATYTSHNYIGKSNWISATDPYQNADQLFSGTLFDFRGYKTVISHRKIINSFKWGKQMLGIN